MISKITRGSDVGGLLAYLFGPGRHNEHTDPHVVAHWSGLPGEAVAPGPGGPDLGPLTADLRTDLRAAGLLGGEGTVWHCSLAIPAGDGLLTDAQWRQVAEEVADAIGLEDDQAGAVRWVAVRHGLSSAGNDHIHIAAALAGRTRYGDATDRTFLVRDYAAVRAVCNRFERAWRLTATGAGTGAAHQEPTRAETEIAARRGLGVEHRVRLERAVRSAAVAARGPQEFAARLAAEGITVTFSRESEQRPGTWLAAVFSTTDYLDAAGVPVAFSGRSLARDLTAPALQARWDARAAAATPAGRPGQAVAALVDALAAAAAGGTGDLAALRGQVAAGADALWAAAEAVEDDRGGAWHTAAAEAARAAREPGAVDRPAGGRITGLLDGITDLPRGRTRQEAELARAWAVYTRLLRAWVQADRGEAARAAAGAAAAAAQLTAGTARRGPAPGAPAEPAARTATTRPGGRARRGRAADGPEDTSARSGA
jgi:hypothetical protein